MKTILCLKKCLALLVTIVYIFLISGCVSTQKDLTKSVRSTEVDMVILVGKHSNSLIITAPIVDMSKKVYSSFGNMSIIVVDGTPIIVRDDKGCIIGFYDSALNEESRSDFEANSTIWESDTLIPRTAVIKETIDDILADSEEVDLIASLFEATKALNAIRSSDSSVREIAIIDTGLSTKGAVNFLNEELQSLLWQDRKLTSDDVKQVISDLDSQLSLPDLNNIQVTWYGLGSVCSPQPELTSLQKYNLRVIWGEILKKCEALKSPYSNTDSEYGFFIDTLTEGEIECGFKVTPIIPPISNTNEEDINNQEKNEDAHAASTMDISTSALSNERLGFKSNSSEYADEELVLSILKPYAEEMLKYLDSDILLVGTTSDPDRNGGDVELSKRRAKAVKNSLIKSGVNENRITIRGIGSTKYLDDLYNANEWQNNRYIESEAEKNRAVHIIPMNSELAKKILSIVP